MNKELKETVLYSFSELKKSMKTGLNDFIKEKQKLLQRLKEFLMKCM